VAADDEETEAAGEASAEQARPKAEASEISDAELLVRVRAERAAAIGFDQTSELKSERVRALEYAKGEMADLKTLPNRSKAVSTDVQDAIDTVLPDLMEILTGGDDVASFNPVGAEDEKAAQQETEYVKHVVFQENNGWLAIQTMIADALGQKIGAVKYWWEDRTCSERLEGKTAVELQMAGLDGIVEDVQIHPGQPDAMSPAAPLPGLPAPQSPIAGPAPMTGPGGVMMGPELLYDFTVIKPDGRLCLAAIPPEDIAVSRDTTIELQKSPYCAIRGRPRVQELIERGIDAELARSLPAYGDAADQETDQARDTAGESTQAKDSGLGDARRVETFEHYIQVLEGSELVRYRVETDAAETKVLEREKVSRIRVAAITPYIVSHRFHGRSVADRMMEIQRIKTSIVRAFLDSIYFALNQRNEVSMAQANEFTIADLIRNEPGVPVRSVTGQAVRPLQAGGQNFNALEALEYFATVGEQRSGIIRAAQGLNPDTLHDTAKGMGAMLNASNKRVRMIARTFAETGLKDLFVGVHELLRENRTRRSTERLRGEWVQIAPTTWGRRDDMTIEIGLGASGREAELAAIAQETGVMTNIIQMQGGAKGPIVYLRNVYNQARRFYEKVGCKAPELYLTDPDKPPPPPGPGGPQEPGPPPPDPHMMEVHGKLQAQQAETQGKLQLAQAESAAKLQQQAAQSDAQLQQQARQAEQAIQLEHYKADLQHQAELRKIELEDARQRMQLEQEIQLKRELAIAEMQTGAALPQVEPGGEPG
jgi:hypothetical protein